MKTRHLIYLIIGISLATHVVVVAGQTIIEYRQKAKAFDALIETLTAPAKERIAQTKPSI